jgi:hypothetical protein
LLDVFACRLVVGIRRLFIAARGAVTACSFVIVIIISAGGFA